MRSQLFRFRIDQGEENTISAPDTLYWIERLLVLFEFYNRDIRIYPRDVSVDGFIEKLFSQARKLLWISDRAETSKTMLRFERSLGQVDRYYDVDVLRITEPRITFIYDFISSINKLAPDLRARCIAQLTSTNTHRLSIDRSFANALNLLIELHPIKFDDGTTSPDKFKFARRVSPKKKQNYFKVRKQDLYNTLHEGISGILSGIIQVGIADGHVEEFILSRESAWLTDSSGDPFEILGVLSRDCNAHCDFCYVLGNPSNTAIKLQKFSNKGAFREAATRLKYFSRGKSLPVPSYDTEEITTHPNFLEICQEIRRNTDKIISITTNGYRLTDEFVKKYVSLAPVDVSVSLNASDPQTRAWLMGGAHDRGLKSLEILRSHRVPMAVTIAAWPKVSVGEIRETIQHIDQFHPRSISVLLGGYTKLFPNPPEYKIPDYWDYVLENVRDLRQNILSPLIIQPRMYEEQRAMLGTLGESVIVGTTYHSPASRAGLQPYDVIVSIDGHPISSRMECLALLSVARAAKSAIQLQVTRQGRLRAICVSPENPAEYIYGTVSNDRYGIHLIGEDIPIRAISEIFRLISAAGAKNVLLCTSMVVMPYAERLLRKYSSAMPDQTCIDLQIVPNRFLGGNIVMGDMLVVDDFLDFIEAYLLGNECDLVLIPSGPFNHGQWWCDLKGQPFELIRRHFRVPVEIIDCGYFE